MADLVSTEPRANSCPTSTLISSNDIALVVDVDGTLISTDMLYESFFASIAHGPKHHWSALGALVRGKAYLKAYLGRRRND